MTREEAFLAQARSDYAIFELLSARGRAEVPECHILHYFQMATEKLAKAVLLRLHQPFARSHEAFSHIPAALAGRPDVLRLIGSVNPQATAKFLVRAAPLFAQISQLSPAVAGRTAQQRSLDPEQGQNVEYPWWQTGGGSVVWLAPANHSFPAFHTISAPSGDGLTMRRLVKNLLDHLDRIP